MGTDRQTGREWAGWLPGRYAGFGSAVSLNELCSGFSCTTRTSVCLQCRINRKREKRRLSVMGGGSPAAWQRVSTSGRRRGIRGCGSEKWV